MEIHNQIEEATSIKACRDIVQNLERLLPSAEKYSDIKSRIEEDININISLKETTIHHDAEEERFQQYHDRLKAALGDAKSYPEQKYGALQGYLKSYQTALNEINREINKSTSKYADIQLSTPDDALRILKNAIQAEFEFKLQDALGGLENNYDNKSYEQLLKYQHEYELIQTEPANVGLIAAADTKNQYASLLASIEEKHKKIYNECHNIITDYKNTLQNEKKIFYENNYTAKSNACNTLLTASQDAILHKEKLSNLLNCIHEEFIFTKHHNISEKSESFNNLISTTAQHIAQIDPAAATIIHCSLMIKNYQNALDTTLFNPARRDLKKGICKQMQDILSSKDINNLDKIDKLGALLKNQEIFTPEALKGKRMATLKKTLLDEINKYKPNTSAVDNQQSHQAAHQL